MSKFLTPILYNGRGLENQLRNCIYQLHDLACGCNKVQQHIIHLFTPQKCQDSTLENASTTHAGDGEEEILEAGTLEQLFALTDDEEG